MYNIPHMDPMGHESLGVVKKQHIKNPSCLFITATTKANMSRESNKNMVGIWSVWVSDNGSLETKIKIYGTPWSMSQK